MLAASAPSESAIAFRARRGIGSPCASASKPWTDGTVNRSGSLYNVGSDGQGVTWKNCTFVGHGVKAISVGDTTTTEIFDGCTFTHDFSALANGSPQSSFAGSQLTGCHFTETSALSMNYFIGVSNVTVMGGSPTHVDGSHVTWNTTNGSTGDIAPATY